jgi:hypothetical protein
MGGGSRRFGSREDLWCGIRGLSRMFVGVGGDDIKGI